MAGIAIGAVLTILHGPWMWASLFGLPILSALAVVMLYHVDNQQLRRSFQFAIILSLAVHLLIMVFASVTTVFKNGIEIPERRVAQRQVRTIEISDQRASFVWEDPNSRETPEPDVQPTRENTPTTDVKPQPVPVEQTQPEVSPQLTRRETTQSTVPRQNRELSRLRRQRRNQQLRSSQVSVGQSSSSAAEPAQAPESSTSVSESSSRADQVTRRELSQPEPAAAAEASPSASQTEPEITRTAPSARRATEAPEVAISAPQPSSSSARIRRSTPRMPASGKSAPIKTPEIATASSPQPTALEPAQAAGDVTRRPTRATVDQTARVAAEQPERSPQRQITRATERRNTQTVRPSISTPDSLTSTPRRATRDAAIASSPVSLEQPSRVPESQQAARELNPRTLSVSRSSEGAAGAGRGQNLAHSSGAEPSPCLACIGLSPPRTHAQPTQ